MLTCKLGYMAREIRPSTDHAAKARYPDKIVLPSGDKVCVFPGCGIVLTGRQQRWCGKECAEKAFASWDWKSARGLVFERDKGICLFCKVDTKILQRRLQRLYYYICRRETRAGRQRGCAFVA